MFLESEHDKYKNKAIFLAGLPGAGKTTIANAMFSFDDNLNISIYNAKKVSPDIYFEKKFKGKINYESNREEHEKVFKKSKELRDKNLKNYTDNKLPVIIDGVGRFSGYIMDMADGLKRKGYEVYMVFIDTSLKKALERNRERRRSVEDNFVVGSHNLLKDNKNIYKEYFGKRFYEIDNNKPLDIEFLKKIGKEIME